MSEIEVRWTVAVREYPSDVDWHIGAGDSPEHALESLRDFLKTVQLTIGARRQIVVAELDRLKDGAA